MPFDFLLGKNGDIVFDQNDIALVSDTQRRVRQEIEVTLKTFTGEWFNNINFGGLNRDIIYAKGTSKAEVDAWFKSVIIGFPEVTEITSFESTYNSVSREYDVNFTVLTVAGDVSVKVRPDIEVLYRQLTTEIITPVCDTKTITASIAGWSAASAFISVFGSFGAIISSNTASMTAIINKQFAQQTMSGTSSALATIQKFITASIANTSNMVVNNVAHVITSTISNNVSSMTAQAAGRIAANITNNTSGMSAQIAHRITATISNNTSVMVAGNNKTISANIGGNTSTATAAIATRITATVGNNTSSMSTSIGKRMLSVVSGNTSSATAQIYTRITANIGGNTSSMTATRQKLVRSTISNNTSSMTGRVNRTIRSTVSGNTSTMTAAFGKRITSTINNTSSATAVAYYGDSINVYDSLVLSSPYVTSNYWKLHEDYTGVATGSARRTIDLLNPSSTQGYFTSSTRPTYNSTPLLSMTDSRSVLGNSFGIDATEVITPFFRTGEERKLSLSFWMRTPADIGNSMIFIASAGTSNWSWTVETVAGSGTSGRLRFRVYRVIGNTSQSAVYKEWYTQADYLLANTTYHIGIMTDLDLTANGFCTILVNGNQNSFSPAGTVPPETEITSLNGEFLIGPEWNGNLECVSLHRGMVSLSDMQALYNTGRII